MNGFWGRGQMLRKIDEHHLKPVPDHLSVVGPREIGKTMLLQRVCSLHAAGSGLFLTAAYVDFRHDPPETSHGVFRRIAEAIQHAVLHCGSSDQAWLAKELHPESEQIYEELKTAVEVLEDSGKRLLLILDGCDPVLQNSAIPRNVWDGLRALAQRRSLRLMTGTRAPLHELCYNPESRVSDFFRIFYDSPLSITAFDEPDWGETFSTWGLDLDEPGRKEVRNWTGGHPSLVKLLHGRLAEGPARPMGKTEVDTAAHQILATPSATLASLWQECPDEVRGDLLLLAHGEASATEIPVERLRFMTARGLIGRSGNKVRIANRFMEHCALEHRTDVSSLRQLFGTAEGFASHVRPLLELRLAQIQGADRELLRLTRRAIASLPDTSACLNNARDLVNQALNLIWSVEVPSGKLPERWFEEWRDSKQLDVIEKYRRDPRLPEDRGQQCSLLRQITGQQYSRAVAAKVTKPTYVLVEHLKQVGDMRNHWQGEPSFTMAVTFCFGAIELCEALSRDLSVASSSC